MAATLNQWEHHLVATETVVLPNVSINVAILVLCN